MVIFKEQGQRFFGPWFFVHQTISPRALVEGVNAVPNRALNLPRYSVMFGFRGLNEIAKKEFTPFK
jgi:hypothetical protein